MASKTFYSGVFGGPNHASLSQILFQIFYLKDLTWLDNKSNMYLSPEVAVQQLLDPSPQTSHPRKEKKGGGWGTSAAAKSSGV